MGYGIGLDVCKAWIDAHVHGMERRARFPNTDTGLEALRHWLAEVPVRQCVLEATGGYEQQALDRLHAAGVPMVRINPRQGRDFAKPPASWPRPTRSMPRSWRTWRRCWN